MLIDAREHAVHIMNESKTCTHDEGVLSKADKLKVIKSSKDKNERFVNMKNLDMKNEKMDKERVKKAHSARACRKPDCKEKHHD